MESFVRAFGRAIAFPPTLLNVTQTCPFADVLALWNQAAEIIFHERFAGGLEDEHGGLLVLKGVGRCGFGGFPCFGSFPGALQKLFNGRQWQSFNILLYFCCSRFLLSSFLCFVGKELLQQRGSSIFARVGLARIWDPPCKISNVTSIT